MLVDMTGSSAGEPERLLDGRYRLGRVLGSGGAAEVIRAVDERLDRAVAIKLFRGDVADQLQRHEDEMRTLARLAHAGLVTVFDAGTDDDSGRPYLVMQLVEGSTLADQLRAGRSRDRTAAIGAALADALSYVHGQGLVHRDVKPANVLIGADAGSTSPTSASPGSSTPPMSPAPATSSGRRRTSPRSRSPASRSGRPRTCTRSAWCCSSA